MNSLLEIQKRLGGSITKRTNRDNTHRYYLGNRDGMIHLVHRINGNIRGHSRTMQFKMLCDFLNITYKAPVELTINNAWYAGYFDSDGTIVLSVSQRQITVKVTSKYVNDIQLFVPIFGGRVQKQKTSYD